LRKTVVWTDCDGLRAFLAGVTAEDEGDIGGFFFLTALVLVHSAGRFSSVSGTGATSSDDFRQQLETWTDDAAAVVVAFRT
jgi:hypothetical protein